MVKAFRCLLCALAVFSTGCIRDGLNDCPTSALIYITVLERDVPDARSSYSSGNVGSASVYIFDGDSRLERVVLLSKEDIENRTPVEVAYTGGNIPKVVVWGNLNGSQETSPAVPGLQLSSARIRLLQTDGYTHSPDNLYYGLKELNMQSVQEVPITVWVGRISIAVHGIEDIRNNADNLFFTIESKYNGYDFYGVPQEGSTTMRIDGEINEQQDEFLTHKPVNVVVYPSSLENRQTIVVKLYRKTDEGEQLLASVDTDIEGNNIEPNPGENTNVLINFTQLGTIEVSIKITPWDYVYQWSLW